MTFNEQDEKLYEQFPPLRRIESVDRTTARLPVLQLLPKHKVGAELGVFAGRFSQSLFGRLQPEKLYLVDGWELVFGKRFPSWGQYYDDGDLTPEMARQAAQSRAEAFGGVAEVVVSRTVEWLKSMPSASLDWIYSDSSHMYD